MLINLNKEMNGEKPHTEEENKMGIPKDGKGVTPEELKLNLPENGEQSSNMMEQTKIKVDTNIYSHYIE